LHFLGIRDSEGENPHGSDILDFSTAAVCFVSRLGQRPTFHNTKHKN